MKSLFLSLLLSVGAMAQSITIPSQTVTTPVTINGTSIKLTITIPAQTVAIPGTSGLPSGITYANNVLTVAGSISTGMIALTAGPVLPNCASASYLLSPVSVGSTTLQPSCYVPPTLAVPPIAVSQSASPINTLTFTP